ncbi:DNA-3-methyladenine glycosylase family protein [Zhongshania aliphaticivorans]|uniref:DNA-3-methyladenine glycosylase family protein n=1 Tax=Zhongshania aliphaticivorans TaxID=1470434 RepID=UPI0012E69A75|nr:3-methyladenine DNA glycosylase 2 [Zhongshania aliphaticivorans]CAA0081050.1 DNA-3-methyladenine glycosylase [Zhongshania aliphaticivorans]
MAENPKGVVLEIDVPLPTGFRFRDVLAFHGRDKEQVSERVYTHAEFSSSPQLVNSLDKAMLWDGLAACLCIHFSADVAKVHLHIDAETLRISAATRERWCLRLEGLSRRMLGLDQDVESFEEAIAGHRVLADLVRRRSGLRVPQSASPFESLCWAVTGQQISVNAAISIRRRFIQSLGVAHSQGLLCHPDPASLAASNVEQLRSLGLSIGKANTLLALAAAIESKDLAILDNKEKLGDESADAIRAELLAIRGIGPWTVNYVLLRGFGYLGGSLHGDVAVRRNLQLLLGRDEKITAEETQVWLAQFSPWRALVAAHLWAMQSDDGF